MGGQFIYGKYETGTTVAKLDACGGHFGVTPDSDGKEVYHYHVQDAAPFTFGCFGPILDDVSGNQKLVSLTECRVLYDECGNDDQKTYATADGNVIYDPWCPCFDGAGSNVGTAELPAFADGQDIFGPLASEWKYVLWGDGDGVADPDGAANSVSIGAAAAAAAAVAAVGAIVF
jgi:hypothetical protein